MILDPLATICSGYNTTRRKMLCYYSTVITNSQPLNRQFLANSDHSGQSPVITRSLAPRDGGPALARPPPPLRKTRGRWGLRRACEGDAHPRESDNTIFGPQTPRSLRRAMSAHIASTTPKGQPPDKKP